MIQVMNRMNAATEKHHIICCRLEWEVKRMQFDEPLQKSINRI